MSVPASGVWRPPSNSRRNGTGVTILEAGPALGGTWHFNDYPGAACDVPSHFYSYSFAQRSDWTKFCSPQEEILGYIRETASSFAVDKLVVPDRSVTSCAWDETDRVWRVTASNRAGETFDYVSDAVVMATGQLNQPAIPRIPGEEFEGEVFHSARWDHDYDLRGKRVAVIGTGASAVQFVPEIAPLAGQLTVFQRTGNWFLPRENKPLPRVAERAVRRGRAARRLSQGAGRLHGNPDGDDQAPAHAGQGRESLVDVVHAAPGPRPGAARQDLARLRFGCKRVLFSSKFLPTLGRPNVDLVTEAITAQTATGLTTSDGVERAFDCIIYSTGFKASRFMFPMAVTGTGGTSLKDVWEHGAHAHLGICVPGFPSLYLMYGPNTNTSGGSIIFFLEAQARWLRQAIALGAANGAALDLRPEIEAASDRSVQRSFAGTAWTQCDSWYQNEAGRVVANWPKYMRTYAGATRSPDPGGVFAHRLSQRRSLSVWSEPVTPSGPPGTNSGSVAGRPAWSAGDR